MIIYTKLLWFASALTINQNLIIINSKYSNDEPLLIHERVHQTQMKHIGTLTFWWRYLTSKVQRQAFEVEAYRAQILKGASIENCAKYLSIGYALNISYDSALKLLSEVKDNN